MTVKHLAAVVTIAALSLPVPGAGTRLSKDQQILHALNRLTFGPTPGQVDEVNRIGLKKWIDLQLHPERIAENPVLSSKLQPLSSLQMPSAEIVRNYPPPQYVVAVATGRAPLPDDPEQRQMLERLATRYKKKLEKKNVEESDLKPAEKTPLTDLLTREQIRTLRNGTPDERAAMLQ